MSFMVVALSTPRRSSLSTGGAIHTRRYRCCPSRSVATQAVERGTERELGDARLPLTRWRGANVQLSAAQVHLGIRSVAVQNGSHCVGMSATSEQDAPDLAAAKKAVGEAVADWLDAATAERL